MIDYIVNNLSEISTIFSILIPLLGMLFWSHRSLHADFKEMKQEIKEMRADTDRKFEIVNSRIDKMYEIILSILKKEKE